MFTKKDTKIIKGLSILLMLAHHLFAFPERIPDAYKITPLFPTINGISITMCIGRFGKICVPIFMFLGGYGMYRQYSEGGGFSLRKRILCLYQAYWKVFLIYIPIGFLFFQNQPLYCENTRLCTTFSVFDKNKIISNFLVLESSLNTEWWFLKTYLCTLFLGYLFIKICKKNQDFWIEFAVIVLWGILIRNIFPGLPQLEIFRGLDRNLFFSNFFMINEYCTSFFMGIVFAKYQGIERIQALFQDKSKFQRFLIAAGGILLLIYTRVFLVDTQLDLLYVPLFIMFSLEILSMTSNLWKVLHFIGLHSTNMWLIHSFYCYYFWGAVKLVYGFRNSLIDFMILVALSLISSIGVDKLWKMNRSISRL